MESQLMLFCLCSFAVFLQHADSLAVMSVDLGSEFMKVAIVKPGVPMEIVLNKESRRKTSVALSMRDGERLFGDSAMATQLKKPSSAFWFFRDLLGKSIDHPDVKLFKKRFPYYDVEAIPETNLVALRLDSETVYSAEELVAMVLEYAKQLAEDYAEQPIKDAVVTVPQYFTQAERQAFIRAANISGINLLQLMGDAAAVALNYGVFRRKEFNSSAQHYLFYDVGSSSTTATVISYQMVKMKEGGFMETNPQLTIKGIGFDRTLGGLSYQLRLRNHLADAFKKKFKIAELTPRALAKLFREAGRLKAVLSANPSHIAQIESLQDDHDFKLTVTRDEFEEMCSDLFDRAAAPITQALQSADIPMDLIDSVLLMGGGTRMPRVQKIISDTTGRKELGKSINTDEAAALGAVYQAAFLSKGFRVKRFAVKEASAYPIVVKFTRQRSEEKDEKTVTRTLFSRNNPYPQKKVMTFNKHTSDFSFNVSLGDLKFLTEAQLKSVEENLLQTVEVTGVEDTFVKHKDEDSKGIKAHFSMDESGVVKMEKVESIFETLVTEAEEESTLSKLGSTISNFFGGGDKDDENASNSTKSEETKQDDKSDPGAKKTGEAETKQEESDGKADEKQDEKKTETDEKTDEKDKKETKKDDTKNQKSDEKTADKSDQKNSTNATDTVAKPKPVIKKDTLPVTIQHHGVVGPDEAAVESSRKTLRKLRKRDEERMAKAKAINDLESFIVNTQEKLWMEEYELASTEEEREKYKTALSEASDWLYEQPEDAGTDVYRDKTSELRSMTRDWFNRVKEAKKLPEALSGLKDMLNHTEMFIKSIRVIQQNTTDDSPFTEVEITAIEKLLNETTTWRDEQWELQKAVKPHEKPVMTAADVAMKMRELDREMKYLLNKAKYYKPKPKSKPTNGTEEASNSTSTDETPTSNPEGSADDPDGSADGPGGSADGSDGSAGSPDKTEHDNQADGAGDAPIEEPPTDSTTGTTTTESSTPRQDL